MNAAPSLWSPVAVGTLTLRHRLIMAAMGTGFPTPEGGVTDRLMRYLARRARGEVALVTTEAAAVDRLDEAFVALGDPRHPTAPPRHQEVIGNESGVTDHSVTPREDLVELRGFEPLTPRLPALCSPN